MPTDLAPLSLALPVAQQLLQDVLDLSPTGTLLLRPVWSPANPAELTDFAYVYLNPAAQRQLRLPAQPAGSLLTHFPTPVGADLLAFCAATFQGRPAGNYALRYPADGLAATYQVAARRSGDLLLVSLADAAGPDSSAMEEALQASQAREQAARAEAERQRTRLANVFQQAPAAIAVYDGPDFVFELVNPAYQRLLPGRALLGKSVRDAFPEAAGLPIYDTLRRVFETGVSHEEFAQLIPIVGPAGGLPENRYFNFTLQARRDEQAGIDGVIGFGFEVTEQVGAQQHADALQAELLAAAQRQAQAREAFYQVFEQTPALIQLLRAPGHRVEYANPAYQRLFPGRPLVGLDLAQALPELQAQGFIGLLDHVYQTGEPHVGTETAFVVPALDGQPARTAYFNFTYQAYQENGQIAGVSVFAFEVSEQVLARQERETQRQQLAEVFEQAPVAICVFRGPAYVLDVVNPPMGEMLGRPLAELVGRPFFEALPELTSQGLPALLDAVRRTGTPFVAQEQEIRLARHRSGEAGYFAFTYQPLRDDAGQVAAITCVAVEVTEQVLARQQVQLLNEELAAINEELLATNEELQDSNQQLTRTNVDLDTFVYTASHDLKAPITNIEGILGALRETLPAAVQQEEVVAQLLGLLEQTVERFQTTITQLTDLSRLQQAHMAPAEPVFLASVIADVRLDLAPVITQAAAQLRVAVPADLWVSFSPANLRSIVYNLLSNAVKYRDPARPAQVLVRAERWPGAVVLTVQDNGLGLTPAQQSRLFGLFQRLHTHVEGTGVGLYMIKRLIENAGGRIAVTSEHGLGTTFTVTFPA